MGRTKLHLLTIPLDEPPRESELAHGFRVNNLMVWLPKSQIQDWTVTPPGVVSVWCPEWLVADKGLDMFIDTSYEPSLF